MATTRTADRSSARERARQRRIELDKERQLRDEQIESAVADFYTAADQNEELRVQIEANERAMGEAIQNLVDLDEKPQRAQALLQIDAAEWKRLKPAPARRSASPVAAHVEDGRGDEH